MDCSRVGGELATGALRASNRPPQAPDSSRFRCKAWALMPLMGSRVRTVMEAVALDSDGAPATVFSRPR